VAFYSNADNLAAEDAGAPYDVFLYDRKMEAMRRVSAASDGTGGNGDSVGPAMSANGKVLVFYSYASNLVDDDLNGDSADVFRVDLMSGAVTLLSRNADGTAGDGDSYFYAPSLSSNGRYLAFTSAATNLVAGDTNGRYDEFLIRVK
jgi:Tol biopolymer transport system component